MTQKLVQLLTERQDYETPPDLVATLAVEFGGFDVDVAASEANKKVPRCCQWQVPVHDRNLAEPTRWQPGETAMTRILPIYNKFGEAVERLQADESPHTGACVAGTGCKVEVKG